MRQSVRPKYRAQPVEVDGIYFPSKAEAKRYCELRLSERAGTVADLRRQVPYKITLNGIAICTWRADFVYRELPSGEERVEDVKGFATPVYKLKKRLVEAQFGVKIIEVRA